MNASRPAPAALALGLWLLGGPALAAAPAACAPPFWIERDRVAVRCSGGAGEAARLRASLVAAARAGRSRGGVWMAVVSTDVAAVGGEVRLEALIGSRLEDAPPDAVRIDGGTGRLADARSGAGEAGT